MVYVIPNSNNISNLKSSGYTIVHGAQAIYFDIFKDDTYFSGYVFKIPLKR